MKTRKHKKSDISKPSKTRKHGGGMTPISRKYYKSLPDSVKKLVTKKGIPGFRKYMMNEHNINEFENRITKLHELGYGAFGSVFKGSINGKYTHDGVTKVYFKKNSKVEPPSRYTSELARQETLQRIITSQRIGSKAYSKPIKKKNFFNHIDHSFQNRFREMQNLTQNDQDLYMVKMPYLGKELFELYNNNSYDFERIPKDKLATEILRLLLVVFEINDAGYIHGDIHATNVLVNLDKGPTFGEIKGDLTIIDFDFFSKIDDYFTIAANQRIIPSHMPLEAIILFYHEFSDASSPLNTYKEIDFAISNLLGDQYNDWKNTRTDGGNNIYHHTEKFYREILDTKRLHKKNPLKAGYDIIKNNIDLYGVGRVISMIINYMPNRITKENDQLYKFIKSELLPNILDGYTDEYDFNRWSIKDAITRYLDVLKVMKITIPKDLDRAIAKVYENNKRMSPQQISKNLEWPYEEPPPPPEEPEQRQKMSKEQELSEIGHKIEEIQRNLYINNKYNYKSNEYRTLDKRLGKLQSRQRQLLGY